MNLVDMARCQGAIAKHEALCCEQKYTSRETIIGRHRADAMPGHTKEQS